MGKRRGNQISLTRSTTKTPNNPIEKPLKQQTVVPSKRQNAKESSRQNVKATIYFSQDLTERLDIAQVKLRKFTGKRGHDLSRSAIIEAALTLALNELDAQKEASSLAVMMA